MLEASSSSDPRVSLEPIESAAATLKATVLGRIRAAI
jgi:hypothetical protein